MNPIVKKAAAVSWILAQAVVLFLLLTGSELLLLPLFAEPYLPLGTPATWFLLIAFPINFLWLSRKPAPRNGLERLARGILWAALAMGVGWGVAGYFLAGNWAFNFTNAAGRSYIFWSYIKVMAGADLMGMTALGVGWIWRKWKTGSLL